VINVGEIQADVTPATVTTGGMTPLTEDTRATESARKETLREIAKRKKATSNCSKVTVLLNEYGNFLLTLDSASEP
jgi:hypothetical protein